MEAAPGVGLAAPQVGVPVQLAVLHDGPERWGQLTEDERTAREPNDLPFTVLINPTLRPVHDVGTVSFYEGHDRRATRVTLTDEGKTAGTAIYNDVVHHVSGLVAQVPEDQRRLLLSTLRAITGDAAARP